MSVRFLLPLTLLVSQGSIAQDTSAVRGAFVTLAPLSAFGTFLNQCIRPGLMIQVSQRIGLFGEAGLYPSFLNYGELRGWMGTAQLRYSPIKNNWPEPSYVSLTFMTKELDMHVDDVIRVNDSVEYRKDYRIQKRVIALSLQFTRTFGDATRTRWYADVSAGLGYRRKQAQCTGITEQEMKDRDFPGDSFIIPFTKECGDHWYITPEINVRVGYRFWTFRKRSR